MLVCPVQITAFHLQLAIIFYRSQVIWSDSQGPPIIILGQVEALQLAIGKTDIGQHIGVRTEGFAGLVKFGKRGFISTLVDQRYRVQIHCVAGLAVCDAKPVGQMQRGLFIPVHGTLHRAHRCTQLVFLCTACAACRLFCGQRTQRLSGFVGLAQFVIGDRKVAMRVNQIVVISDRPGELLGCFFVVALLHVGESEQILHAGVPGSHAQTVAERSGRLVVVSGLQQGDAFLIFRSRVITRRALAW